MKRFIQQSFTMIRMAWQKNLSYRFTIAAYRIGEIAEMFAIVFMWSAIYAGGNTTIKGFTLPEMITYVLLGNLFLMMTRNFLVEMISWNIRDGKLSSFLVKPISYIRFMMTAEFGRVAMTTTLSIIAQIIIICLFSDKVVFNTDPAYLAIIAVMIILACGTELIISFLVGCVAFWADEAGGLQSSLERIRRFFSGGYFPLSLLPAGLATASIYLPFGYSFYVPASLYLKKMTIADGLRGLAIQVAWIGILSLILWVVWKLGLRRYEAVGS